MTTEKVLQQPQLRNYRTLVRMLDARELVPGLEAATIILGWKSSRPFDCSQHLFVSVRTVLQKPNGDRHKMEFQFVDVMGSVFRSRGSRNSMFASFYPDLSVGLCLHSQSLHSLRNRWIGAESERKSLEHNGPDLHNCGSLLAISNS
jgi:hypothetical protein